MPNGNAFERLHDHLTAFDPTGERVAELFAERVNERTPGFDPGFAEQAVRRCRILPEALRTAVAGGERTRVVHRALFDPAAGGAPLEDQRGAGPDLAEDLSASLRQAAGDGWDPALEGAWRSVAEVVVCFVFGTAPAVESGTA